MLRSHVEKSWYIIMVYHLEKSWYIIMSLCVSACTCTCVCVSVHIKDRVHILNSLRYYYPWGKRHQTIDYVKERVTEKWQQSTVRQLSMVRQRSMVS